MSTPKRRGPPRAAQRAFRIIAHPHYGVLVDGRLISLVEWNRLERIRASKRNYMRKVRAT